MLTGKEDIIRAITEALSLEKGTRDFYAYIAAKTGGQVGEAFNALRDMELRHMQYFDFLYLAVTEERDLLGYKKFSKNITAIHVESGRAPLPRSKSSSMKRT